MPNAKNLAKYILWGLGRPFHTSSSWPCRVLAGPAKGCVLTLDIRSQGSYWLGSYDTWILNRLNPISHLLSPGDTAWDCGAFVGYYTAVFRQAVGPIGHVHTFEASQRNFSSLRRLPALNNWDNVTIHHLAVGPDHCTINFAGDLGGSSGPLDLSKSYQGTPKSETVRCSGLDELIVDYKIKAPRLIKLDLESAEEQALHNGHTLFSTHRPVVILEWHGEGVLDAISRFLDIYQYNAWDVLHYQPQEALRSKPLDPFHLHAYAREGMSNTLICIP
jgi:FkbM family methyltransferase